MSDAVAGSRRRRNFSLQSQDIDRQTPMTAMADLCRVVGDERTVDNLKQEKLGKNALKEKKLSRQSFGQIFPFGEAHHLFCVCVCGSLVLVLCRVLVTTDW